MVKKWECFKKKKKKDALQNTHISGVNLDRVHPALVPIKYKGSAAA